MTQQARTVFTRGRMAEKGRVAKALDLHDAYYRLGRKNIQRESNGGPTSLRRAQQKVLEKERETGGKQVPPKIAAALASGELDTYQQRHIRPYTKGQQ